jgi:hypothetical protein
MLDDSRHRRSPSPLSRAAIATGWRSSVSISRTLATVRAGSRRSYPAPLPHYCDPDADIARVFREGRALPTTVFHDASDA